jgi:RNA-binding protein
MLSSRQRSYLRSLSNTLPPIFQVGKGGISENMIKQFADALEARELIKATVLNNSLTDAREICQELSIATQAQIVQVIGSKFVLYKESKNNKVIELP